MKTRILSILLCLCLVFSVFAFASCGKDSSDAESDTGADGTAAGTGEGEGENNGPESSVPLTGKDAFYASNSTLSQLLSVGNVQDIVKDKVFKTNFAATLGAGLLDKETKLEISSSSKGDKFSGNLSLGYGNEKGHIDILSVDGSYYIGGGNLLNKYIKLGSDNLGISDSILTAGTDTSALAKSIEKFVSGIQTYCQTSFADEKYVDSTEKVTFDGSEITLNVVTLDITASEFNGVLVKLLELLVADDTISGFICDAAEMDKSELIESINEMITEINDSNDISAKIVMKLYNNTVVGCNVEVSQTDEGTVAGAMKFAYTYLVGTNSDEGSLTFEVTGDTKLNLTYKATDKTEKPVYNIALDIENVETDYEIDENTGDFVAVETAVSSNITALIKTTSKSGTKTEYTYELKIKPNGDDATKISGTISANQTSALAASYEFSVKIENTALEAPVSFALSVGYEYTDGDVSITAPSDIYSNDEDEFTPAYYTDLISNLASTMPEFILKINDFIGSSGIEDDFDSSYEDPIYAENVISVPNYIEG